VIIRRNELVGLDLNKAVLGLLISRRNSHNMNYNLYFFFVKTVTFVILDTLIIINIYIYIYIYIYIILPIQPRQLSTVDLTLRPINDDVIKPARYCEILVSTLILSLH